MYSITKRHIQNLPVIPYRKGAYEGVVCHCTDNSNRSGGDTPSAEAAYMTAHYQDAFTHYIVGVENGQPVILELADPAYACWGAGHVANERFVQIELCMYDAPSTFQMAYGAYVWLVAKLLRDGKLQPSPAPSGTVWAHADVTKYLGGTDHTDPIAYLQQHGISWQEHLANVTNEYNRQGAYIVSQSDAQKILDLIGAVYTFAGGSDEAHRLANEVRKAANLPTT